MNFFLKKLILPIGTAWNHSDSEWKLGVCLESDQFRWGIVKYYSSAATQGINAGHKVTDCPSAKNSAKGKALTTEPAKQAKE